jgi:hypothetical protein
MVAVDYTSNRATLSIIVQFVGVAAGNLLLQDWNLEKAGDLGEVTVLIGDWGLVRRGNPQDVLWTNMSDHVGTGERLHIW